METQLGTTNLLLGIMAAVSLLEAIALIAAGIAGWNLYNKVSALAAELESRQVAPLMSRVNTILDDVQRRHDEGEGRDRARRPRDSIDDGSRRRYGGSRALERARENQPGGRLRPRRSASRSRRCCDAASAT